ncbi:GNAT family N-acetyltransferase [Kribbella sp. NPDC051718]|uniref:GNAT family N-acetyltransferase n=1 Tax=Kribbella sp. NPDC051718 TaxID=3155168 RepID=UPI003439DED1
MSLQLIEPTVRLHAEWLESHAEWGPGLHEDGFGISESDELESPSGFAAWIARLHALPNATLRWILEDNRIQGGIALRHHLHEQNGHIGYGIRPSARGHGLATWALGEILNHASTLGLPRVMLVCLADNLASTKTIEHHGGVLTDVLHNGDRSIHRYWIDLADRGHSDD